MSLEHLVVQESKIVLKYMNTCTYIQRGYFKGTQFNGKSSHWESWNDLNNKRNNVVLDCNPKIKQINEIRQSPMQKISKQFVQIMSLCGAQLPTP